MATQTHTFGEFPNFTKLTLDDKEAYESFTKDLPPVDDILFSGLMSAWWNPLDNMAVSTLNNNVVIPYWLAGEDNYAGLSLIGTNKVDESICTIFDYLREHHEPVRLTHVPDFVVANIQFPELFRIKERRRHAEYIIKLSRFYPLEGTPFYWRQRVKRHLRRLQGHEVVVRKLNLNDPRNVDLIITSTDEWQPASINNLGTLERDSIHQYVTHAQQLEIQNMCLFVDGDLYGYVLYHLPHDTRYVNLKHIKATDNSTRSFELMGYLFTKTISELGVSYININSDMGSPHLRMFMLALGPTNFFRKYIIEPVEG